MSVKRLKHPKEKMTAYIMIRMTEDEKKRARRHAKKDDISIAQWFRVGRTKELELS